MIQNNLNLVLSVCSYNKALLLLSIKLYHYLLGKRFISIITESKQRALLLSVFISNIGDRQQGKLF
jgi:hypothetical protein